MKIGRLRIGIESSVPPVPVSKLDMNKYGDHELKPTPNPYERRVYELPFSKDQVKTFIPIFFGALGYFFLVLSISLIVMFGQYAPESLTDNIKAQYGSAGIVGTIFSGAWSLVFSSIWLREYIEDYRKKHNSDWNILHKFGYYRNWTISFKKEKRYYEI